MDKQKLFQRFLKQGGRLTMHPQLESEFKEFILSGSGGADWSPEEGQALTQLRMSPDNAEAINNLKSGYESERYEGPGDNAATDALNAYETYTGPDYRGENYVEGEGYQGPGGNDPAYQDMNNLRNPLGNEATGALDAYANLEGGQVGGEGTDEYIEGTDAYNLAKEEFWSPENQAKLNEGKPHWAGDRYDEATDTVTAADLPGYQGESVEDDTYVPDEGVGDEDVGDETRDLTGIPENDDPDKYQWNDDGTVKTDDSGNPMQAVTAAGSRQRKTAGGLLQNALQTYNPVANEYQYKPLFRHRPTQPTQDEYNR